MLPTQLLGKDNLNPKRFMTAFINMNQIYIDEPAVSVASHFLMSSSLNLQACQLCLGCGGNRGFRFSPTASCTCHLAFLTRQFQFRIGNQWEAWHKAHHNHISWRHKGSSFSYERPLKPLEPRRHVGKTCQNHIQIISPKHPLCQINNQNVANPCLGSKGLYVL